MFEIHDKRSVVIGTRTFRDAPCERRVAARCQRTPQPDLVEMRWGIPRNTTGLFGGFDLATRSTWFPGLTIDRRCRLNYRLNFDFMLPGEWYWRSGLFENFDNLPPAEISKNHYGWSNASGLKF